MEEEANDWDALLQHYLIDTGGCIAGGLAQVEDGVFYAAAPTADEKGWEIIFKEDHEEEIWRDDGTLQKVMINERDSLKATVDSLEAPKEGLWLGGEMYRIVHADAEERVGDSLKLKWLHGVKTKLSGWSGVHIIVTKTQVVVGVYDPSSHAGNCKKAVVEFAEWLHFSLHRG
mmetsp:Transcript_5094/g.8903  ORF Transcript_5094/g.8903 Transcript_5094/m.8903 type:complete len:173 (+) Transcript_5094:75-593(+)